MNRLGCTAKRRARRQLFQAPPQCLVLSLVTLMLLHRAAWFL